MSRLSALSPLLALAACAPKVWVNPQVSDPQQMERDRYACMKENSALTEHLTAGKSMVQAGQSIEVDPQLFDACMRARGYTPARSRGGEDHKSRWIRREAHSQGPVIEAELGAGRLPGLMAQASADLSPLADGSPSELEITGDPALDAEFGLSGRAGLVMRPSPTLDLGVWLGVRSSSTDAGVSCGEQSTGLDVDESSLCQGSYGSRAVPVLSVGARARPPSAPRLWAGAELGAQTVGPIPADDDTFALVSPESPDGVEVSLHLAETPGVILPFVRGGVGLDLVHSDPLGVALGCGIEVSLRGKALGEGEGQGPNVGGTCTATLRLSPRGSED